MLYPLDDIKKDIRIQLEMNNVSEQLLADIDENTLSMEDVILARIIPAAEYIHLNAPSHLLDNDMGFGCCVSWDDEERPGHGSGYLVLPENFLRLVSFMMSDWKRQPMVITPESNLYPLQTSKWSGLRGNPEAPVVCVNKYPVGTVLEIFSCDEDDAQIKMARYIPRPNINPLDAVDMSSMLYLATVTYAASLVAITYNSTEVSQMLRARALEMAQIQASTQQVQE